ncbi:uncharacterized protein N7515_010016 [Penicillium bovifimosum]|uniref:tRNA(Ile)-lysidine synthetase n=1 Tax=Penicillium bovifimosum TaxID=126998 RepID=A0A9W9GHQ0_9EURO|nr:uncharacterized protein N7515_010016 [Penicillium bovifimosum]KAJ5120628.1 hypothetical protein N7515_010016 [Penicillium bovifimosum]
MTGNISISPFLFQRCFQQAWSGSRRARVKYGITKYTQENDDNDLLGLPRSFGIAVSGGADSMALAYLCKQLERSSDIAGAISVTALVVDHRARPESTLEAQKVASWLRDMDIKTQILTLDWTGINPKKNHSSKPGASSTLPTAFETHARRLRFQALGVACHTLKLETLLLGHHQDDNVETTIWRLSAGASGLGLGGIPEVARIPECHGIFGVSESWSTTSIRTNPATIPQTRVRFNDRNHGFLTFSNTTPKESNSPTSNLSSDIKIASPGIFICRPLLSFTKASLIETCEKNQIPYVSDPTNFDPTLTPRNAIRSLRSSNSLPKALDSPSILSLIRSSQTLYKRTIDLSNTLLSTQCRLLNFNPKSGSATIQFLPQTPASLDPSLASLSPLQSRQLQSLVLRRITELVSPFPDNHVSLRSYETLVPNIFPDPDSTAPTSDTPRKLAFTQAGVLFQHLANDTGKQEPRTDENIWFLSRQRFMRDRDPVTHVDVSPNGSFTSWFLWDNRYWLRLRLVPSEPGRDVSELSRFLPLPVTIRPFHKLDMERVRRDTVNSRRGVKTKGGERLAGSIEHVQALFSAEAPSQLRFTLPVIVREGLNTRPGKPLDLKVRELLALPTLEYRLTGHAAEYASPSEVELLHVGWRFKLKWQWMYKMIDIEALRLMGWPVGGNTDA